MCPRLSLLERTPTHPLSHPSIYPAPEIPVFKPNRTEVGTVQEAPRTDDLRLGGVDSSAGRRYQRRSPLKNSLVLFFLSRVPVVSLPLSLGTYRSRVTVSESYPSSSMTLGREEARTDKNNLNAKEGFETSPLPTTA